MKKGLLTLAIVSLMVMGANAQTKTAAEKAKQDTLEYAIGAYVMQNLAKNGISIANSAMFKKAIDDVMANRKLLISENTVETRVVAYQNAINAQKGQLMERMLFTELSKQSNVVRMPSGVNYAELTKGSGRRPDLADTVVLNIVGTLPDGSVFIDSKKEQQSFMLLVKDLVPGLQDAVLRMAEGSLWRVFVPSALGYGASGNGMSVPPNTPLVYDVALVQVRKAP